MRETLRPVHFADRNALEAAQLGWLRTHVADIAQRSPFYRALLQRAGLRSEDLRSLSDLARFPFTTRADIAGDLSAFVCVPPREIIEHVSTSGTTGRPVPFVLSARDLDRLAANEANSLASTGIGADDVVQITTTLDDRFIAGLAYHGGLRLLGAGIVRTGPGNAAGQWRAMLDHGTTALIAVPSFVLRLLDHAAQHGIDPKATRVRRIICIGEPVATRIGTPNALAERIRSRWNVALHGTYASTESATASTETRPGTGHAVQEHLLFTEVLDDAGRPVASGAAGELVITPLQVDAMPLFRFRTGDICTWQLSERADGSYGTLLGPILGRKEQRMKIKGTTLFPAQVIDALATDPRIARFAAVREHDADGLDHLRVLLDAPASALPAIAEDLRARLRVMPELVPTSSATIAELTHPKGQRKPSAFIDRTNPL